MRDSVQVAELQLIDSGGRPVDHRLVHNGAVIGQASSANIVIPHSSIASRHLVLLADEDGVWWVKDLGSGQWTGIDRIRLLAGQWTRLHDAAIIEVGSCRVVFSRSASPVPPPPPNTGPLQPAPFERHKTDVATVDSPPLREVAPVIDLPAHAEVGPKTEPAAARVMGPTPVGSSPTRPENSAPHVAAPPTAASGQIDQIRSPSRRSWDPGQTVSRQQTGVYTAAESDPSMRRRVIGVAVVFAGLLGAAGLAELVPTGTQGDQPEVAALDRSDLSSNGTAANAPALAEVGSVTTIVTRDQPPTTERHAATTTTRVVATTIEPPDTAPPLTEPPTTAAPPITEPPITEPPVTEPPTTATPPPTAPPCNYDPCLPLPGDYDCNTSANGPNYVSGTVRVIGQDVHDLDRDNDGVGCE